MRTNSQPVSLVTPSNVWKEWWEHFGNMHRARLPRALLVRTTRNVLIRGHLMLLQRYTARTHLLIGDRVGLRAAFDRWRNIQHSPGFYELELDD